MERFRGKVAVITGSSAGIGKEITKELMKREVIVVGLARNMKNQQELATEMLANPKTYTGKFYPIQCDVSKEAEITKAFASIKENIGPIAILVNNAAVLCENKKLTEFSGDDFNQLFNVNLKGVHLCTKAGLSLMTEQSLVAHIVNINSIGGLPEYRAKMFIPYVALKHAMRAHTKGIRTEILENKQNVKVSELFPGMTDTPMVRNMQGNFSEGIKEKLMAEDVAKACIMILDTPPDMLITELIVVHRQSTYQ